MLIPGAVASQFHLEPHESKKLDFKGPVLIIGGGISGYSAARELARNKMESIIFSNAKKPQDILATLSKTYPGSHTYHEELRALLEEVFNSPFVKILPDAPVEYVIGNGGQYIVGFKEPDGNVHEFGGSSIILSIDREYVSKELPYIGGGERVIDQVSFEERVSNGKIKEGKILFWVTNSGDKLELQRLSLISALRNSQMLIKKYPLVKPVVFYPAGTEILEGSEILKAEGAGVELYAYTPETEPVVQKSHIAYIEPEDHLEHELEWDIMVLPSLPGEINGRILELTRWFPVSSDNGKGLKRSRIDVTPGHEVFESIFFTGSAFGLCDLNEALFQGKKEAIKIIRLKEKAEKEGITAPAVVCNINEDVCEGCGLCEEICPSGAVKPREVISGPVPRRIEIHNCHGGGTCAASCPYQAIQIINHSKKQLEAKVKETISYMKEDDVLGFICSWGGASSANLAAVKGLTYSSQIYMIQVNCLGSIDPTILSMTFLNGVKGILLVGCKPGTCHYSIGIDHCWVRVNAVKKLFSLAGLERDRIGLGYVGTNEPEAFVRIVESFVRTINQLKPIKKDKAILNKLTALHDTLYCARVRWILGVRLKRPNEEHYTRDQRNAVEFDGIMSEILSEEYLAAQIISTLKSNDKPLNPHDIARAIDENIHKVTTALLELIKERRIVHYGWKDGYPLYTV